jgi:transposase InsO family protein
VAWCGDVTYIPTDEGWLYLASVLGLASRHLLRASIFAWIHRYNRVRLHSTIGYLPPVEWERQHALDHPLPSPLAV